MYFKNLALFLSIFFTGCTQQSSNSPQEANNKTPFKLVVCNVGSVNCVVTARYDTLNSCEYHKRFSNMLCDSFSEKGKMICEDIDYERTLDSPSYCLND